MSPTPQAKPRSDHWQPSDRERLIFHWVKFDGHKQAWVAQQLEIHQSTVSRIVHRYERWLAHGGPAQEGELTPAERLRSQHWLTYERNEWILASALRLAGEMERSVDTSDSTITHHASDPSREIAVKTHHATLDRSATAARFLSLAYRINMDQLKLVQQQLPPLDAVATASGGKPDFPALADLPELDGSEADPGATEELCEAADPSITDLSAADPSVAEHTPPAAAPPAATNPKSEIPNPKSEIQPPLAITPQAHGQVTTINLSPATPPVHKTRQRQSGILSLSYLPETACGPQSAAPEAPAPACISSSAPSNHSRLARSFAQSSPLVTQSSALLTKREPSQAPAIP